MKYMGSKARHAKEILSIVLKDRTPDQTYVEPFVGGCNTIDKVQGKRIGSDVNEYLIAMWKAVSEGWLPPDIITEEDYKFIRNNKEMDKALTGYAGIAMSFGGKWFGGYRRDIKGTKDSLDLKLFNEREQSRKSFKSLIRQQPSLFGVDFKSCSYNDLTIPNKSIVYCDPPYKGTTGYKDAFDHEPFYNWCRELKNKGCSVFVSEYSMPDDFTEVWSKEVNSSLTQDTGSKKNTEKLFSLL